MLNQIIIFIFTILFSLSSYAAGGITHMMIARETIPLLPYAQERNLISNNMDAYLVGANYPDSGYVKGVNYGEDSHWEPFINAFIDYLREKYTYPELENPKLVAFLLGCTTHVTSDIQFHRTFLKKVAEQDFHGDWNQAHTFGDEFLDFYINIDRNQWAVRPTVWWVPVNDLVAIYHKMGKDQYKAKDIIWGDTVYSLTGFGERGLGPFTYYYTMKKMPWTIKNYYTSPDGGIAVIEKSVAEYETDVWDRVTGKKPNPPLKLEKQPQKHEAFYATTLLDFAAFALKNKVMTIAVNTNKDGSVDIQQPIITDFAKYQTLLSSLQNKYK